MAVGLGGAIEYYIILHYITIIMDETEIITQDSLKDTIEKSSIDELMKYKAKLRTFINIVDNEIENRQKKKEEANSVFK